VAVWYHFRLIFSYGQLVLSCHNMSSEMVRAKRPVMFAPERIVGSLTFSLVFDWSRREGAFPCLACARQVLSWTFTDRQADYCSDLAKRLNSNGFRAKLNWGNERSAFKIASIHFNEFPIYDRCCGLRRSNSNKLPFEIRAGERSWSDESSDFEGCFKKKLLAVAVKPRSGDIL